MRRIFAGLLTLLLAALPGCASYRKAMYGDGPASTDYDRCSEAWHEFVPLPARRGDMASCMRKAGWELKPGPQPEGPAAYQRIEG